MEHMNAIMEFPCKAIGGENFPEDMAFIIWGSKVKFKEDEREECPNCGRIIGELK